MSFCGFVDCLVPLRTAYRFSSRSVVIPDAHFIMLRIIMFEIMFQGPSIVLRFEEFHYQVFFLRNWSFETQSDWNIIS